MNRWTSLNQGFTNESMAKILRAERGNVPVDTVLNLSALT